MAVVNPLIEECICLWSLIKSLINAVCACHHLSFTGCGAVRDGDMCHVALYESCDIPHIVISAKLWSTLGT